MYYTVRPNLLMLYFLRKALWRVPTDEKKIYLTFDDGPVPEVTTQVLDMLDEHRAKATFFCVGDNVQKHPGLFAELQKRGHAAANHSFSHANGWKTGNKIYFE